MRRRLLLLTALAGLLTLLVGACSSGSGSSAAPDTTVASPATTAPVSAPPATGWRVWWVVDDHVAPGDVHAPTGGDDIAAALDALVAGPTPQEAAFGAGTALTSPRGTIVLNSLLVGLDGIAHVDFNRNFETADTRPQVSQVVFTLTQFPGVKAVQFLIDGQPNGATGVPPVGRADVSFPGVP